MIELWKEFEKCKNSPYYFYTNYWKINGEPATTTLSEEEFNKAFGKMRIVKTRRGDKIRW